MSKDKLKRYAEILKFPNVIRPSFEEIKQGLSIKGNWNNFFFDNANPIVVELGCGGGEYTVGLARLFPCKNFIGVDIKGARIWKGAKTALEEKLINVGFLRTRIEFIENAFANNEVDEIWITFPDPQPKKSKAGQRLTSSEYLNRYKNILKSGGIIHLKTDNTDLHNYSQKVIFENNHSHLVSTCDLHALLEDESHPLKQDEKILSIPTFYEQKFRKEGAKICYLRFKL
jgi:tRNA (guanine-N7-)-methyltransferase